VDPSKLTETVNPSESAVSLAAFAATSYGISYRCCGDARAHVAEAAAAKVVEQAEGTTDPRDAINELSVALYNLSERLDQIAGAADEVCFAIDNGREPDTDMVRLLPPSVLRAVQKWAAGKGEREAARWRNVRTQPLVRLGNGDFETEVMP
jgi:hypothetical protein